MLRTSCSQFDAATGKSEVTMKLPTVFHDMESNRFWRRYAFPVNDSEIKVSKKYAGHQMFGYCLKKMKFNGFANYPQSGFCVLKIGNIVKKLQLSWQ
jgi:hypothetical protein